MPQKTTEELLADFQYFEEWVKLQPPNSSIGYPATADNCPITCYLKDHNPQFTYVVFHNYATYRLPDDENSTRINQNIYFTNFVRAIDNDSSRNPATPDRVLEIIEAIHLCQPVPPRYS